MFIFGILCRWGGMAEIITNNAAPYIAGADWLCKTYHINHIRISSYNSQANGVVESKHFDVREAIMTLRARGPENQRKHLEYIVGSG